LKGQGLDEITAAKRKQQLKEEKQLRRERRQQAESDLADEAPRQNRLWQDAAEDERRQGLPVKLSDGSLKRVRLEGARPQRDDDAPPPPAADAKPLGDRARKRLRKQHAEAAAATASDAQAARPASDAADGSGRSAAATAAAATAAAGAAKSAAAAASPAEKKMSIAQICTRVTRDPEGQIGGLAQLHSLCLDSDPVGHI
jgi:hypothetical protein